MVLLTSTLVVQSKEERLLLDLKALANQRKEPKTFETIQMIKLERF